jgi:hypothetical protein
MLSSALVWQAHSCHSTNCYRYHIMHVLHYGSSAMMNKLPRLHNQTGGRSTESHVYSTMCVSK